MELDYSGYDSAENALEWAYVNGDNNGIKYTLEGGQDVGFTADEDYVIVIRTAGRNASSSMEYQTGLQTISNISTYLKGLPQLPFGTGYGGLYWEMDYMETNYNWDHRTYSYVVYQVTS